MNEDGDHNGGLYGSLNSLNYYVHLLKPSKVVMVWDGPGGSKKRLKLFSDYKSQRKIPSRMCRAYDFLTPEEERESMFRQLGRFKDYLSCLPVYQLSLKETEADDIIAWASHYLSDSDIVIISTDKDFLQLVSPRVKVYNPITKILLNENTVEKKYGTKPLNLVMCRALDGDKSDNIPGVNGIGIKTAIKMFPLVNESDKKYPDDIFEYAEKHTDKGILYKRVLEKKKEIIRNYKIMQLRNPLVSGSQIPDLTKVLNSSVTADMPSLRLMFMIDKLYGQIKNLDNWVLNFLPLRDKEG